MAKKTSKTASKPVENGLKAFSIHSKDEASKPVMAALTSTGQLTVSGHP